MADPEIDALFLAFQQAVVGRYSLEREIGRGGMGVVYLAREVRLDRSVAIKLLPPELAANPDLRDRFMREARTAARLSHPYIVPIHAVEEIDGFVFIVMAYVDGGTLAQRIASRGAVPPDEVTGIMREVAWALAYAHAQGVVHRDIKPANILLERGTGRALVADFGIARITGSAADTATGIVLGTPEYMSPEQAADDDIDGRSDLYALGVVAFLSVTGTLPLSAPTAQELLTMHLTTQPPAVASVARGIPRPLAQAIDRCLRKDREHRFATGEALADALEPGLERAREVPVPIRSFLDRRRMMMLVAPTLASVGILASVINQMLRHGMRWSPLALGVGFAVVAVGVPFALLVSRLRRLMRLGYGLDDIGIGLRAGFDRRREEFLFEWGPQPTRRERLFHIVGRLGLVVGAGSLVVLAVLGRPVVDVFAPIAFAGLYLGSITTAFSSKWRRLRTGRGSMWSRFWSGAVGQRLAQIATFRLGDRAVPANRPTELAIAMSAEAMFHALPKELRESLGDLPEVLRSIEAHARVERARIDELDAALAEAQSHASPAGSEERQRTLVADLVASREEAGVRLAALVSALENLRLDLLRLRAGGGSVEGITIDLATAREFGAQANRLIAGGREVERALSESRTPAS
ncbi:MAG TPA: serine/threonine-protein kinase [Gemmatimonadaceae bacterium]|jgi:serine/threonine-protein kinase